VFVRTGCPSQVAWMPPGALRPYPCPQTPGRGATLQRSRSRVTQTFDADTEEVAAQDKQDRPNDVEP
jgi:hypothetical protein